MPLRLNRSVLNLVFAVRRAGFKFGAFIFLVLVGFFQVACNHDGGHRQALSSPTPLDLQQPREFVKLIFPDDNPMTVEGVSLGRKLFYDPILSRDSTIACASCHRQSSAFTDGLPRSLGIEGRLNRRSAPSLVNVGYHYRGLFWDGRVATLEEQAIHPIEAANEMDFSWEGVVDRLKRHKSYPSLFREAFSNAGEPVISKESIAKSLAQFQRTLISNNSKYDRVLKGEDQFTELEEKGKKIFFDEDPNLPDSECGHCHTDPVFSSLEYLNNGIDSFRQMDELKDPGRAEFSSIEYDAGKFKTPTLRNIALTAPYMHDGRFQTLEEVVEHYNAGGHYSLNASPNVRPLHLEEADKIALIAFLHCLTDSSFIENPAFADPF